MAKEYIDAQQAREFADTMYAHDPVARMICRALLDAAPRVEIAAAPAEPRNDSSFGRWIPVTERLPEPGVFVLVAVTGRCRNAQFDRAFETATYYPDEGWILEHYPGAVDISVSHWLDVPVIPPEEG